MDYYKKAESWRKKSLEKGEVECIHISDGNWRHTDKYGVTLPDSVYYCMRENGERVVESYWTRKDEEKPMGKAVFLIKDRKKMIFVPEPEKAYGFGFGEESKGQSIVLYIRSGGAALLVWSDAASTAINYAHEINERNPENLDCLVGFMENGGGDNGNERQNGERGGCH